MALVIEDGTGSNPAANSYQSVNDLRDYATLRGVDLSSYSNLTLESLLIQAMDFIEAQRQKFKGEPTTSTQPLTWPRFDVWDVEKPGVMVSDTEIPRLLRYAQLALAIEAIDADLMPNQASQTVTKEKVGAIEVTYSDNVKQGFTSAFAKPHALLTPLYKRNGFTLVKV